MDALRVLATVVEASDRTGYIFRPEEVSDVVEFASRKCAMKGRGEDYFYLLLADELKDFVTRMRVNSVGEGR